jgi:hypothetical protein
MIKCCGNCSKFITYLSNRIESKGDCEAGHGPPGRVNGILHDAFVCAGKDFSPHMFATATVVEVNYKPLDDGHGDMSRIILRVGDEFYFIHGISKPHRGVITDMEYTKLDDSLVGKRLIEGDERP